MLRLLTAGESHGAGLALIIDGLPFGLDVETAAVEHELERRRVVFGRGPRMRRRRERVRLLAGVHDGRSIGAPVCLLIGEEGGAESAGRRSFSVPRPGHADLAGSYKFGTATLELIWERASARETAARVAAGAVCRRLLDHLGARVGSFTTAVGTTVVEQPPDELPCDDLPAEGMRCPLPGLEEKMRAAVERAAGEGDSLGGRCRVIAEGVLPGLGGYAQPDRRLDAAIAGAMMSIPSVKGVMIGQAERQSASRGSEAHDSIDVSSNIAISRGSNLAGGIEGGISNGQPIVVDLLVKPVPTLAAPPRSVDLITSKPAPAPAPRSDVCVVGAVGIIGEAELAIELARAVIDKFGADTLDDLLAAVRRYRRDRNLSGPESEP